MKSRTLEQITVRRAKIADTDKVRYRIYKTPDEFIAVIAESALMAVKVSGIAKPHKIVRDLPTDGVAVEAKKMAAVEDVPERVSMAMAQMADSKKLVAELTPMDANAKQAAFRPMALSDLQRKGMGAGPRILPPEMLSQIIEEHTKVSPPTAVSAPVAAPVSPPSPPPVPEIPALPEDHPLQMVKEALSEPNNPGDTTLSPEEVEQLLNG